MPLPAAEMESVHRLESLLHESGPASVRSFDARSLDELVTLYRFGTGALRRVRDAADDPALERRLNELVGRAYALIYAAPPRNWRRFADMLLFDFPRTVRRNAMPMSISFGLAGGLALLAFAASAADPQAAYSLMSPEMAAVTEQQLKSQSSFRGNFTFSTDEAQFVGAMIAANNIIISLLAFVGGIFIIPTLYVLVNNALMVGAVFGLAAAHGRLRDMANLLLCHGTLELTAFALSGGAGLAVGIAWIAPGRLPRKASVTAAAADAGILAFGIACTLLIAAGIEAFVTPFTPPQLRAAIGVVSGLAYAAFLATSGRAAAARQNASAAAASR